MEQKLGKLGESKFIHWRSMDCNVYAHSSLWMRPTGEWSINAKMVYNIASLDWICSVSFTFFFISLALASKEEVAIVNSCVYNKSVCILYTCVPLRLYFHLFRSPLKSWSSVATKFGSKMQQGLLCMIMSSNVAHQGQNYTENVKLV